MQINCKPDLMKEHVADTGLTYGWILNVLKTYDPKFKQTSNGNVITSITARDISENKGYCSKIFLTNIYVDNEKEPIYNFVMKIPTTACIENVFDGFMDENEQNEFAIMKEKKMFEKLSIFHNVECDFYDIFKDFKGLPMPKVSYTQKWLLKEKQMGVIFMEDLSGKIESLGIFGSLNEYQIKDVVKHLASFHAHLFETENIWKNRFNTLHMLDEEFFEMIKKMNDKVIETHPEFAKPLLKLDRMLYDKELIEYSVVNCCKDLGVPSLLALGDLWTNNVMFERSDDNVPNKVLAFVDFQLAFEGNPAFDLARMITLCTDAEIRRELESFICDFYYENLVKFMGKNGRRPDFKAEQFKKAYDYGMINQATWLPMMSIVFSSNHEVAENIQEARNQKLALRTKFALEDAVKKLESLQPSWIPTFGA